VPERAPDRAAEVTTGLEQFGVQAFQCHVQRKDHQW